MVQSLEDLWTWSFDLCKEERRGPGTDDPFTSHHLPVVSDESILICSSVLVSWTFFPLTEYFTLGPAQGRGAGGGGIADPASRSLIRAVS